jgi:BlaI family transcriptional regulator, penicillinase repressor
VEQLSDVQLAFMRALWSRPGSSVAQVKELLSDEGRELAQTTVATQLGRLEKKGLIAHEVEGRQFLYRALVSEEQVRRSVLARVTEGLFGGDVTALVHQLLDHDRVSAADLAEVKRLIEAKTSPRGSEEQQ